MWIVQELRGTAWVAVSPMLAEAEAWQAVRILRSVRPWRAYQLARA
jgi:hypothetical protein